MYNVLLGREEKTVLNVLNQFGDQLRCKLKLIRLKSHLEGQIEVEEVDQEGKYLGSDECFSAHVVDQREGLEEAHLARNRLLEGARDHLLDGEVEDVDGGEAGEADPVELFEQVGVGPASNH